MASTLAGGHKASSKTQRVKSMINTTGERICQAYDGLPSLHVDTDKSPILLLFVAVAAVTCAGITNRQQLMQQEPKEIGGSLGLKSRSGRL